MKKVTIEIDDNYGNVLSLTASGTVGIRHNVTVVAVDLQRANRVKIDENGKAWITMESEDTE